MKEAFESLIPIDKIHLDKENPRLPEISKSQRDTIIALSKVQGNQLIALANHIVTNGFDPSAFPIVVPTKEEPINYIVLDGNRRLNALKVLETPEILLDSIPEKELKKLKALSSKYHKDPVSQIKCIVFPKREEADMWIQLKHRGQNEGAGSVEWSGQVSARYDERRGKQSPALQVLDFIKEKSTFDPKTQKRIEEGKYPVTTLDRLLNTTYVRDKLGLVKKDGRIQTKHDSSNLIPSLKRIVDDIGTGQITVSDLKNQTQRIDYINSLGKATIPGQPDQTNELADLKQSEQPIKANPKKKDTKKSNKKLRLSLIPKDCYLTISQHRINDIYVELKNINVDDFPNSVGIMMRVFIELSLDHYLEHTIKWPEQKIDNTSLQKKMLAVIKHFETSNLLTNNKLEGIRNASNKQSILGPSYKTLHGFIHNYNLAPIPSELRKMWDNIQPFFLKLWS